MLMVQNNAQLQLKPAKVKGPPPVPPRPNQSVVAEALAKTRKAVAESKSTVIRNNGSVKEVQKQVSKAKTLERTNSVGLSVTPKQNGLARVKSFIRDVISDRSSSSDEKKSSGHNSRRSSSDSSSIPTPTPKKPNESFNTRAVKSCKQILGRSLSTSNRLDQDTKNTKVAKSSSFADKTIPIRKAPPPPLSPKPKLRQLRPSPLRQISASKKSPRSSPEISPYASPIDAKPPISINNIEEPYACVVDALDLNIRLQGSIRNRSSSTVELSSRETKQDDKSRNSLERKTSKVTERLISEILESRNQNESHTVIDKGKSIKLSNGHLSEIEIMPKVFNNHEMLIYELQTMRSKSSVQDALDKNSLDNETCASESSEPNYAISSESSGTADECNDQAYAYILDDDLKSRLRKQYRAISTMSLPGLPPLPKSLSGFADMKADIDSPETPQKPPSDLEGQLNYLKKEMASLRQLDLSLLSELWSLSEAMASWRRQLEHAPRLRPAPPPPPPPHYLRT